MRRVISALTALLLCLWGSGASAHTTQEHAAAASNVGYEIFVPSFADADGDGLGDLRGIEARLDYIAQLGADMLWLTPFYPSPSYHHYDVTDYKAVSPACGTTEDFASLAAACHGRGIRVIVDLVVNHTGVEHPWFEAAASALASGGESPYREYYRFADELGDGFHAVPGAEGWYYEGRFGPHMPDLNLDSDAVRGEIADIMAFWQALGADGFRLDAVTSYYTGAPGRNAAFVAWVTAAARESDPDAFVVGECWSDPQTILTIYEGGARSLFNFPAADVNGVLVQAALSGRGAAVARYFADWTKKLTAVSDEIVDAPFLTNHDIARARGMLRSDVGVMKAAAMLYLLLPGRPFVYYGEELGMSGSGRDENKRLPMLWSAQDASLNVLPPDGADQAQRLKAGVAEQEADPDSLLHWYRRVIALRALAPELSGGALVPLDAGQEAVCAFTAGEGRVAVLINASREETATLALEDMGLAGYTLRGAVGVDAFDGEALPPLSAVILGAP